MEKFTKGFSSKDLYGVNDTEIKAFNVVVGGAYFTLRGC